MAKQSGGNTAQRVEALVRPTVEGMGLRLWDVVFEKEGPDWYLRVLIDKTDGTTMDTDTCADVSHALDPILDEADPIEQSYYLEVGSPGLTKEQLEERGMNQSTIHEDVMIGAEDSHITGKCRDGRVVELFRNGVWVL